LGYAGLRSLGATCYVNSIFQQLFSLAPFTHQLITGQYVTPAVERLQTLFCEMLLLDRRACDPQPFLEVWRGWGEPISPNEQQDAFEFFQFLLGSLPKHLSAMFSGEMRNIVSGTEFRSEMLESFLALPLEVAGFSSLPDSLDAYMQSARLENYKAGDSVMEAVKTSRIATAPPVLVFHLKRFRYSLGAHQRTKITSAFDFPDFMDVSVYLCNNSPPAVYELHGVVVHSGSGTTGHYTSFVRSGSSWVLFDDQLVTEVSDQQMRHAANGEIGTNRCAYLLFYVKSSARFAIGDELLGYDALIDLSSYVPEGIRVAINQQNARDMEICIAFGDPFCDFVVGLGDPLVLLQYFISVSCHSLAAPRTDRVGAQLCSILPGKYGQAFQFIQERMGSILKIFKSCIHTDVVHTFVVVLNNILTNLPLDSIFAFMSVMISFLLTLDTSWQQIPGVSYLLLLFIHDSPSRQAFAANSHWLPIIIQFIEGLYQKHTVGNFLSSVDLSSLFEILTVFADKSTVARLRSLAQIGPLILQSNHHIQSYIGLLFALSDHGALHLDEFLSKFMLGVTKNFAPEQLHGIVAHAMLAAKSESQAEIIVKQMLLLNQIEPVVATIISLMKSTNRFIRLFLLKYPTVCIFSPLTSQQSSVRKAAWDLVWAVFPSIAPSRPDAGAGKADPGLDASSRKELETLLERFSIFFSMKVIPHIEDYHRRPGGPAEVLSLGECLLLLESILTTLGRFSPDTFRLLESLFRACDKLRQPMNANVAAIAHALALFPVEKSAALVVPLFHSIFLDCSRAQPSHIQPLVVQFWELGRRVRWSWHTLISFSSFPRVFASLFVSDNKSAFPIAEALAQEIVPLLESRAEVRSGMMEFFSLQGLFFNITALRPLFPGLLTFFPTEFPAALANIGFRAMNLVDSARSEVLSVVLLAADRLSTVPVGSLDIKFPTVAYALQKSVGGVVEQFVAIWIASDAFYSSLSAEFTRLDAPEVARSRLRLELHRPVPAIAGVLAAARESPSAVTAVLTALADAIPTSTAAVDFVRANVKEMLKQETLLTDTTKQFYRTALGLLDPSVLVEIYLELVLSEYAESEESRRAIAKALVIVEIVPESRPTFEEVAPFDDPAWLERKDLWH
jgi:ubiquitin C-terminal hydrolase